MIKTDFILFSKYLTMVAETLGAELSAGKIQFYFELLSDLEIDDIKKALNVIANTGKFFPKPSEIREAVQGKSEDLAVIAVDKIQNALRSVGGYSTVYFDDPIINLLIKNYGGWDKLSDITQDEWKWLKKEFEKQYRVYIGRGVSLTSIPETLAGIHEKVNICKGIPWPIQLAIVGDERKAIEWTEKRKALAGAAPDRLKKLGTLVGLSMDQGRKNK